MLRRIVASSLRFRFLVVAIAAGARCSSASRLRDHAASTSSRSSRRRASRSRPPPSACPPTDVESLVTVPLEQALAGIDGLDVLRSKSVAQLSPIVLIFKPGHRPAARPPAGAGADPRSVTPSLPTWAAPPFMLPPLSATSRVMKIGMSSKTMSRHGHVPDRLLDDPVAAAERAGRGQHPDLGRAAQPAPRRRSSPAKHAAPTASPSMQVMEGTADALDAGLLHVLRRRT